MCDFTRKFTPSKTKTADNPLPTALSLNSRLSTLNLDTLVVFYQTTVYISLESMGFDKMHISN